ncbi:MAG: hypothetical protein P1V97_23615, partial [Planctomycetota bacterium]|nr:hypothetical protein [Planctomycetota bacterium]
MGRRLGFLGLSAFFGLLSLFLPFFTLEAKDDEPSLARFKKEFEEEVERLNETFNKKNPPPTDKKAYTDAKKKLDEIAKLGTRDAALYLMKTLKTSLKNPELQAEAFVAQRAAIGGMDFDSKGFGLVMTKSKRKGDWGEQVDLIYAMRLSKGNVDPVLIKLCKAKKVAVAGAAIRSLGYRKCVKAMSTIIKIMQKHEVKKDRLWLDARQSLTAITGYDVSSARDWKKKWSELEKAGFDGKQNRGKDKFYYPKNFILSQRVVMVLDTSGSMHIRDPKEGVEKKGSTLGTCRYCKQNHAGTDLPSERERLYRGKKYMQSMLQTLRKGAKFNIIHFNQKGRTWQAAGFLVSVNDGAIETALDYLDGYKAEGSSNAFSGFERAYSADEMNTIIYMSDGFSTNKVGERLPYLEVLAQIKNINRFRNARIFTVGFKGTA